MKIPKKAAAAIAIIALFLTGFMVYQAVTIHANIIFVHPRGNDDIKPGTLITYDQFNIQSGINQAQHQGRLLRLLYQKYYVNSGVKIDKYKPYLDWKGGILVDIDGGTNAIIGCNKATSSGDANLMVERKPHFEDITLIGGQNQIGIDIGASYGAIYKRIKGQNLKWVIYTRFGLMSLIEQCFATNCANGFAFGIGNYPEATWSNSQSNSSIARQNRVYMNTNAMRMIENTLGVDFLDRIRLERTRVDISGRSMGESNTYQQAIALLNGSNLRASPVGTAFYSEHTSGVIYDGNIIEGGSIDKGYHMYAPNNTVVKDWTIKNLHYEVLQTSTAAIYSRWAGGIITVDKAQSGHPAIMADIGSDPGYTQITISNVPWWMPKNGKIFTNNVATSWKIINCDSQLYGTDLSAIFQGRAVRMSCNVGGGYDQVCITPINR